MWVLYRRRRRRPVSAWHPISDSGWPPWLHHHPLVRTPNVELRRQRRRRTVGRLVPAPNGFVASDRERGRKKNCLRMPEGKNLFIIKFNFFMAEIVFPLVGWCAASRLRKLSYLHSTYLARRFPWCARLRDVVVFRFRAEESWVGEQRVLGRINLPECFV